MATWNLACFVNIPLYVALGHARFHVFIICFFKATWNASNNHSPV